MVVHDYHNIEQYTATEAESMIINKMPSSNSAPTSTFEKTLRNPTSLIVAVLAVFGVVGVYQIGKEASESATLLNISLKIRELIDTEHIRYNLRKMTAKPHLAGSENNLEVAQFIKKTMEDQGVENVHFNEYDVLLSYPNWSTPNTATILNKAGKSTFKTAGRSVSIPTWMPNDPMARNHWLAFSGNGTVEGDIVYVNKASKKDYQHLEDLNIDVKGKIFLVRLSGGYRGNIVISAAKRGAIGVILYNDPQQVAKDGTDDAKVYPHTDKMPRDAAQLGSLNMGIGDARTPAFPSIKNWYKEKSVEDILKDGTYPSIPCLPISYSDAREIFERMAGDEVIDEFKGKLDVTYRYGPEFVSDSKLRVTVHSNYEQKTIQNVLGYIRGSVEPDRYVILSNHYDAWTNGAVDPNSGTATLLEVSRTLMEYHSKTGWRPERTILFAHWDAEEFGLMGSTEFAEEFRVQLMSRAVGLINMDFIGGNRTMFVMSNPTVNNVVREAAKRTPHPLKDEVDHGRKTWYDSWKYHRPSKNNVSTNPSYTKPGGGSDHFPFYDYLGIPIIMFIFSSEDNPPTYPLYHTHLETPNLVENFIDHDGLKVHRSVAQLFIDMCLQLSDSPIIPYDLSELVHDIISDYLPAIRAHIESSSKQEYVKIGLEQLGLLENTTNDLMETIIETNKQNIEISDVMKRYQHNDRLIQFEKCFILPGGIESPQARHVLFHPDPDNFYDGRAAQQVHKIIIEIEATDGSDVTKLNQLSKKLARHISLINYSMLCGKHTLTPYFSL